jgi:hypothetical protein
LETDCRGYHPMPAEGVLPAKGTFRSGSMERLLGGPPGYRTQDPLIKSQVLYH